jgi:hypothetical protein
MFLIAFNLFVLLKNESALTHGMVHAGYLIKGLLKL